MKNIAYKNMGSLFVLITLFLAAWGLTSCEESDDGSNSPMTITKVYLENARSSVTDREVTFARIGQLLRLEGSGFTGVQKVYFNGKSTTYNSALATDNNLFVQIPNGTPIIDVDPDLHNTIILEKGSIQYKHSFEIRDAAPAITNVSHTMPLLGEWITIEGSGLINVTKVVFPGNIEVTTDIVSDEEGKFFKVKMPEGVPSTGGSIFIECANGGAYSPAFFNCKAGLILDFDGHGIPASWSDNMVKSDDFLNAVIGEGNVSQGYYCPMIPDRLAPVKAGQVRAIELWTSGDDDWDWRAKFVPSLFDASTPLDKIALQFDIYVPEEWNNTGFLGINLANNFDAGNQWKGEFYNYIPWLSGSTTVPFKTLGWTTVTIPFNNFYKFSADQKTFEDILVLRETASYKNFGMFFNNNDFNLKNITGRDADESTEFLSSATSVKVYVDSFRLVSIETPAYSDFPDEE